MILLPASLTVLLFAFPLAEPTETANPRTEIALQTIDAEDIYAYISYLASDALTGRNAGTRGNERAAEWIADFFKKAGLKPGGDDGTYFQEFTFRPTGTKSGKIATSNVVAVWEGSDPERKHEAVVVGAHFDHVGKYWHESNPGRMGRAKEEDGIWNGADDNASGSSAVLEIAQAFSLLRLKTARTIVFVLFSAEEHGLYGSQHYVKHPFIPLEDTQAMINLDMIGRNTKKPVKVLGADTSDKDFLKKLATACASRVEDTELYFMSGAFGGSDHAPFMKHHVPVAFFFTGLHRDYHQIGDHADKIDCSQVARVGRIAFLMLYEMANAKEKIHFNPLYKPGFGGQGNRRMLGIKLGEKVSLKEIEGLGLDSDQGAVRVADIYKGTAASIAGLEEGDLLLSIGRVRIRLKESFTSLREAIDSSPLDQDLPMEIIRKGKIQILTVRWKGSDE